MERPGEVGHDGGGGCVWGTGSKLEAAKIFAPSGIFHYIKDRQMWRPVVSRAGCGLSEKDRWTFSENNIFFFFFITANLTNDLYLGYIVLLTGATEYIYSPRGNLYCFEGKKKKTAHISAEFKTTNS